VLQLLGQVARNRAETCFDWDWVCPDCTYKAEYGLPEETSFNVTYAPVEVLPLFDRDEYLPW
jgi:hypothetical protein